MAYILGQYNKVSGQDENKFMEAITTGEARIREKTDSGISGLKTFPDKCLYLGASALIEDNNYYFHGKIMRPADGYSQIINVKLVYYDSTVSEKEQFIKTIYIPQRSQQQSRNEWVDVEFIFTPMINFDCLLFELQRTAADYQEFIDGRKVTIAYEELSLMKNIIPKGTKYIKLGVQTRPGFLMCINGEEIRTPRTGIFELKNGIITVSFFSAANALQEDQTSSSYFDDWLNNASYGDSASFLNSSLYPKLPRHIDSFTLDYLYNNGEEE